MSSEWWKTYFDAGYLREYEPIFNLVEDRRQVVRLIDLLELPAGARIHDDARVLAECARVLKPGGVMIWQGGSRDGVMARFLDRDWWTTSDGTMIAQDRSFDPLSGFLTIKSTWQGRRKTEQREHRIRLYTASRLAAMMLEHGLVVEQAWHSFERRPLTRRSSEMLLVARKEPDLTGA